MGLCAQHGASLCQVPDAPGGVGVGERKVQRPCFPLCSVFEDTVGQVIVWV